MFKSSIKPCCQRMPSNSNAVLRRCCRAAASAQTSQAKIDKVHMRLCNYACPPEYYRWLNRNDLGVLPEAISQQFKQAGISLRSCEPGRTGFVREEYSAVFEAITGSRLCRQLVPFFCQEASRDLKDFIFAHVERGHSPVDLFVKPDLHSPLKHVKEGSQADAVSLFTLGELARFLDLCVEHGLHLEANW